MTAVLGAAYLADSDVVATATSPSAVLDGPGSVVRVEPLSRLAPELQAVAARSARVVYRSTDVETGRWTSVSGAVFLPKGSAPQGGWPVVAVGHEGSGVDEACAPSLSATLLGEADRVANLLRRGFAVALSDYQGLGMPGDVHAFLDVATAGRNMIDSVRALRGAFPFVSTRWAALGNDQGGGAAWSADQQARAYAPELIMVGAVASSPLTDTSSLVDTAANGALTLQQRTMLLWSLASLSRRNANFPLAEYRHGVAAEDWDALTACSGPLVHDATVALKRLDRFDLAPESPEAADSLRAVLGNFAISDGPLGAPLFASYRGAKDVIEPRWTTEAVQRACRRGGNIEWRLGDREDSPVSTEADQIAWLVDRFDGDPPGNDCASAAPSSPGAGAVLSTADFTGNSGDLPSGSLAARVTYGSTNGDTGQPTVVSATVFAPPGLAPPDGWPVVAYGHPTTGIDAPCAPSLSGTLLGQLGVVDVFLRLGYAVAFSDYEGLGAPGVHPYLDSRTAGLNVIDSVRALRATFDGVSPKWAALGMSQGASAVWAADEQAETYAPELDLVGAVALAPPADVSGMVDKAMKGELSPAQLPPFQLILSSLARVRPDFDVDAFRRGSAAVNWDVLSSCDPARANARLAALDELQPTELAPATREAADQLRSVLKQRALPQRESSAPLSVVFGSVDDLIDAAWTNDAITRGCEMGDSIRAQEQAGKGHGDLDMTGQVDWLAQRFRGPAEEDGCSGS